MLQDAPYIRLLKLEILTAIANDSNVHHILREFQFYVKNTDKDFVVTAIQCIGRIAAKLPSITDSCMTGLMVLVNNNDGEAPWHAFAGADLCSERIVAESVVVLKKLLQLKPEDHKDTIIAMSKLATTSAAALSTCMFTAGAA